MELQKACTRCGGTALESGQLTNPRGNVTFNLSKTPFLTWTSPMVPVSAVMCLDCGAIELTGDVIKAREVAKR